MAIKNVAPEHWLRGPVPQVPPLLQPVAHALLQASDEVAQMMANFPDHLLWEKPAGLASAGFHLQHLVGVLDRLFTYAKGQQLSPQQLAFLKQEGTGNYSVAFLVDQFKMQVEEKLQLLATFKEDELTEPRGVGRAQIPSTVIGLLVHAAEHTMRHVGQLLVTTRILTSGAGQDS